MGVGLGLFRARVGVGGRLGATRRVWAPSACLCSECGGFVALTSLLWRLPVTENTPRGPRSPQARARAGSLELVSYKHHYNDRETGDMET